MPVIDNQNINYLTSICLEKELINMNGNKIEWINKYWIFFKKKFLLDKYWWLKLNNSVKTCGMCDYETKTIFISKKYLLSEIVTLKQIINTLLHEIAHALVGYKQAHNNIWKNKALDIGCDGKIYNDLSHFVNYKYKLCCIRGCYNEMRYKKSNISNKLCQQCKGNLSFISI